jgi:hypothetical protein
MKITTAQLKEALSIVKPALANKEILEQTTSFAFLNGRVITYNDEISISHPFECDFEGAVKAEELYGLLTKITKDDVSLSVEETELIVSSGRMKAGLKMHTQINLPLRAIPKKMEPIPDPEKFYNLVELAMRTCSSDMSTPKLTCVSIKKTGEITGADNYRLVQCKGKPLPTDDFLLPAVSAVEVLKLSPTHMFLEKGWVHFKNKEETVISCRHLEDNYVGDAMIRGVLNINSVMSIHFPDKMEEMLSRVAVLAKRESILDESINVVLKDNKISLEASSKETGSWVREKTGIDFTGDSQFFISPTLFSDILKITNEAELDKSKTKMKFTGPDWEYVIMLRTN